MISNMNFIKAILYMLEKLTIVRVALHKAKKPIPNSRDRLKTDYSLTYLRKDLGMTTATTSPRAQRSSFA